MSEPYEEPYYELFRKNPNGKYSMIESSSKFDDLESCVEDEGEFFIEKASRVTTHFGEETEWETVAEYKNGEKTYDIEE